MLKQVGVAGALALWLTVGTGVASADPRLDSAVSTTCSYSQVMAALNKQSPAAGASPAMQDLLRQFLDAPPPQRQQMAEAVANYPANQQYLPMLQATFDTCNNY